MQNFWNHPNNISGSHVGIPYHTDRGHSRVYHGHEAHNNGHKPTNQGNTDHDFRRFDYTTEAVNPQASQDLRKYYRQCTRRGQSHNVGNDCATPACVHNKCTRRDHNRDCTQPTPCAASPSCEQVYTTFREHIYPHELCPCNTPKTTCFTPTTTCMCNMNCQCLNIKCPTTPCSHILRNDDDTTADETRKSGEYNYHDLFPNIGLRNGEVFNERNSPNDYVFSTPKTRIAFRNSDSYELDDTPRNRKQSNNRQQLKANIAIKNPNGHYSFGSPEFNKRKKRDFSTQVTFKPFWQMDEFTHKREAQLKAIRYTTIPSKRNKMNKKKQLSIKTTTSTESITIKIKDNSNRNLVTDKYLSFEELMHLRKLGVLETSTGARRQASAPASTTSSEITANTPFVRKKHCTRKLTCTWTASSPTGADGSIITGVGAAEFGSRTPPGYVDGCTRTSTCTRDYMDRNKLIASTEEGFEEASTHEDEDYCERRALNIRRRNSGTEYSEKNMPPKYPYPDSTLTTLSFGLINEKIQSTSYSYVIFTTLNDNCMCFEKYRRKRDESHYDDRISDSNLNENSNKKISYGDLYYMVLQKIINTWNSKKPVRDNKCLCNNSVDFRSSILIILFCVFFNLTLNLFIN